MDNAELLDLVVGVGVVELGLPAYEDKQISGYCGEYSLSFWKS